ncbi:MAG TPA: sugar nucleotide-binding protein [Pilimelia sp.]|nr:sugar nucleotide-binding protein [Pilimelia sp.]
MTLLVVGASGHLGATICRLAPAVGWRVIGTYATAAGRAAGIDWQRLDLRDPVAVRDLVTAVRPTAVINAAYRYADWAVSADGAAHLARTSMEVGARLVHVSSDVVHGGRPDPYADDEAPTPILPYGAAKAAAETAVRVLDPGAALVRTSLIIGDEHSKQVRLCLDLITGRAAGALFSDEFRCPVGVDDLAAAVLELVDSRFAGVVNVAGPEAVSRPQLGALVARRYGLDASRLPVSTIAEAGLVRPAEIRLDTALAGRLLRTRLRPVSEILAGSG